MVVRPSENGNIFDKRLKIAKVLADAPIDRTKETTSGALVMNFWRKKVNEKAKKAIDDDNIETTQELETPTLQKLY